MRLFDKDAMCCGIITPTKCGTHFLILMVAGRKRRQKWNSVSNETVRYGLKFCGTWIQE
jgi:hypothetical protein